MGTFWFRVRANKKMKQLRTSVQRWLYLERKTYVHLFLCSPTRKNTIERYTINATPSNKTTAARGGGNNIY
jgi:hypothetical protein